MKWLSLVLALGLFPWSLACLVGGPCAEESCGSPVCVADTPALVYDHSIDFNQGCADLSCVAGSDRIQRVDALLPGDHAVAIGPNAEVTVAFHASGTGDGIAAALTARCEEGTAMRLAGRDVVLTGGWSRWSVLLAEPMRVAATRSDLSEGSTPITLSLSVAGPGRCAVARLRLVTTGRYCTRYVQPRCCRAPSAVPDGGYGGVDTGSTWGWSTGDR
ncbi:MAG: hypothetical protein HY909_06325 [Deltaproteobacteria bacterium]|nr:hypothetical protein [Deltaproteobacteria bacterium]